MATAPCIPSEEYFARIAKFQAIIQAALQDVCTKTNPRKPSAEDIEAILSRLAVW